MTAIPIERLLIGVTILITSVLSSCSPSEQAENKIDQAQSSPKNVVMIIVDDLGWQDTGVYGSSFYETPHIDKLAQQGTRFTQFYSASPVCSPTRASLMTGKHPARLDLTNWIGGGQNGILQQASYVRQLEHRELTMGEAFKSCGYATGYIGKWHLGKKSHLPETQGFDWTFAVNEAGQPGSYFPPYENSSWAITNVPDLQDDPKGTYLTDRLTDAALAFIDERKKKPFFLVLSHYAVHTPLQAPQDIVDRYKSKAKRLGPTGNQHYEAEHKSETKLRQDHPTYAAMIESTDNSVGRVLTKLDDLHLADQTVVVFVSDNGGLSTLGRRSPSQATSNSPLRSGKGWLYEGGIRIPLIIRSPGSLKPNSIDEQMAMTTDVLPTVLQLAGAAPKPDPHVDGVDLMSTTASRPLYWHFPHYHGSGNRPGGAIRVDNLKLIEWFEDGAIELYDLSQDIGEKKDLSQTRPKDAQKLLKMLQSWRKAIDANMPTRSK
ncbi:MAG: arylsulfatase A [Planctomycetota bacterium]